jgi:hypothetical protein
MEIGKRPYGVSKKPYEFGKRPCGDRQEALLR